MRQGKGTIFRIGLGVLFLTVGVAHAATPPPWQWEPAGKVERVDPARYPKAPAVVLLREDRCTYEGHINRLGSRRFVHERIAILNEAGLQYASFRIDLNDEHRLLFLKARTIQTDGTAKEVEPAEVREDHTKISDHVVGAPEVKHRVFRFPGAQVGTIVEFVYEIEFNVGPYEVIESWTQRIVEKLPIVRYQVSFEADRSVETAIKVFNLPNAPPFKQEQQGKVGRATLELKDLSGDSGEDFVLPWRQRVPWWVFRLIRYKSPGSGKQSINATWNHTMGKWLHQTVELVQTNRNFGLGASSYLHDEVMAPAGGLERANQAIKDCSGSVSCVAQAAFALVRDHVDFKGFDESALATVHNSKKILEKGVASSNEKTFLVWSLLERAKITAYIAFTARYIGRELDREFPDTAQFDHQLLYLPEQKGLSQPLWIDPSCEYCRIGEVPSWVAGADAAVMTYVNTINGPKGDVQFMLVEGSPAQVSQGRSTYEVRLGENGDLVVNLNEEARGVSAMNRQLETRTWTAKKWQEDTDEFVHQHATTARLEERGEMRCDKAAGKCRRTLRFVVPGYATRKGAELLVPLTLLHSSWDQTFVDKERHGDLFFDESQTTAEVLRFQLPPGWELAEMFEPTRIHSPALEFSLTVTAAPGTLSVTRWLQTHAGHFDKAEYPSAREVTRAFAAVREKVLVLRKTQAP